MNGMIGGRAFLHVRGRGRGHIVHRANQNSHNFPKVHQVGGEISSCFTTTVALNYLCILWPQHITFLAIVIERFDKDHDANLMLHYQCFLQTNEEGCLSTFASIISSFRFHEASIAPSFLLPLRTTVFQQYNGLKHKSDPLSLSKTTFSSFISDSTHFILLGLV